MKAPALVREVFPDASESEADYLLWERTAFPFNDLEGTRAQLIEFKTASERYPGASFCDFCNSLALIKGCCATCAVDLDTTPLLTA